MTMLICGILMWSVLHYFPALNPPLRGRLQERLGPGKYKAIFGLLVVLSIVLMVFGWRSAAQFSIYHPFIWAHSIGFLLIIIAFIFFGLAHSETNLKRFVRHPQLIGLIIWSTGHLLTNGDNLSLVLFGGMGIWAISEILLLNRRDGAWQKPHPIALRQEIKPVAIALVVSIVIVVLHPYFTGVSPIPH